MKMQLSAKWEFIEAIRPSQPNPILPDSLYIVLGEVLVLLLTKSWNGISDADAEEITEQSIERIAKRIDAFEDRGRGSFRKWCITIAKRTAINWFRDQERRGHPRTVQMDEQFLETRTWLNRDDDIPRQDDAIERCLLQLDPTTLQIMRMHAIDEIGFAAIALEIGLAAATARKRYQRGKDQLAECLEASSDLFAGISAKRNRDDP